MEKICARLNIGNKAEPVKLRKRKSQLYSEEETCPLDNGTLRSWPKVLRMTQILIFTVCCLSLYDGNLHILQNAMKSDLMNCN